MVTAELIDLRRHHRGPVIAAGDAGYDPARVTFNGMLDRRPELIARPLDVEDVASAVAFATERGLPIAVRGGGHSVAGHCIGEGAVVVDLRLMRQVSVDPDTRTATCGGGALWEDLDPACLRHGLATPGGTFGDTGVAGLTLGGGIGHLVGLHGLTLDNLIGAIVVTADGEVVPAREDDNADLFWALRGGGGNFGVVVDFAFRLHPVDLLLGGLLRYRLEDAHPVLTAWRELMADAPDSLACFAGIQRSPMTEEEGVVISVAYFGDPDEGYEAIQTLMDGPAPVADGLRPMYYAELQEIFGRIGPARAAIRGGEACSARGDGIRRPRSQLQRDLHQLLDRPGGRRAVRCGRPRLLHSARAVGDRGRLHQLRERDRRRRSRDGVRRGAPRSPP